LFEILYQMAQKYQWGQTSLNRMKGVDERIIKVLFRAIRIASRKKDGVDMSIPQFGGLRTADEQNKLFENGFSKCDGYDKKSYHQSGKAIDVIPYVKGKNVYSMSKKDQELYFHKVAVCMLQAATLEGVKLEWGGNWKGWLDRPHFSIRD
jgi:peptidoglycan L-alanyl-D-glutamate endopeptidase CwlK